MKAESRCVINVFKLRCVIAVATGVEVVERSCLALSDQSG